MHSVSNLFSILLDFLVVTAFFLQSIKHLQYMVSGFYYIYFLIFPWYHINSFLSRCARKVGTSLISG
jgi:hypothetical protein